MPAGSPEALKKKARKFYSLSEKLEIFGAGGAIKNLADFWLRGPCRLRNGFARDLSLFGCLRGCSAESIDPGRNIYRLAVSIYGDICAFPSRRVDSLRKINEAERPGWMRGPRDPKSPEISIDFCLFGYPRGGSV